MADQKVSSHAQRLLHTYVDEDASADTPVMTRASDTLVGATSAVVHDGLGHTVRARS